MRESMTTYPWTDRAAATYDPPVNYRGELAPDPSAWCRTCHYPLAAHADGICPDDEGTFGFLPLGEGSYRYSDVPDAWGDHLFLFWQEDCWDPAVYVVRGDHYGDAYEWFLDYAAGRGHLVEVDPEDLDLDHAEGMSGTGYVDGKLYWTESVNGREVGR